MANLAQIAEALVGWLARATWQGSVLVLLVLGLQWLLRKRLPPRWRHALWWLVVIRLALPVSPESRLSLFNWVGGRASPASARAPTALLPPSSATLPAEPSRGTISFAPPGNTTIAPDVAPQERAIQPGTAPSSARFRLPPAPQRRPFPWNRALTVLWLCGVVVLGGRLGRSVLRLQRELRRARLVLDADILELFGQCRRRMGVRREMALWETASVPSPALCGLLRPRLLLPLGLLNRFTREELRFVFLHELAHLRRHDILTNWLATLLQCLHWFNPMVWLAFARMRADRELACDALALAHARPGDSRAYGETIIKLLEDFARPAPVPGLVGILEDKSQMRRRILGITGFKPPPRWSLSTLLPMAALGVICLTDADDQGGFVFHDVSALKKKPGKTSRVAFPGVNLNSSPDEPLESVREQSLDRPQVCDPKALPFFPDQSKFHSTPDLLLIGADGKVAVRSAKLKNIEAAPMDTTAAAAPPAQVPPLTAPVSNRADLVVRNFTLDLNALRYNLDRVRGQGPGWVTTNRFQPSIGSVKARLPRLDAGTPSDASDTFARLKQFLAALGVDLSSPKAMFYSEPNGYLTVRATPSDLAAIEQAIQSLNTPAPQVEISVKYVELWEEVGKNDNLFGAPAPVPAGQNPVAATNPLPPSTERPSPNNTNAASIRPEGSTGILTPEQYRFVMKALEQRKNADVLSSPRVTTISGRQTQIKVVDVRYVVTGLTTNAQAASGFLPVAEPFECGPVLDMIPTVGADGHTISMVVAPTIREFIGYDDEATKKVQDATKGRIPFPTPKFRVRQMTAAATLWDGQTLMLGAGSSEDIQKSKDKVPLLADLPLVGRMFQNESTLHRRKSLLIFLTPTIIDSAGNPVHGPDDLPFRNRGIPPQRSEGVENRWQGRRGAEAHPFSSAQLRARVSKAPIQAG